jgi:hypothetical protein
MPNLEISVVHKQLNIYAGCANILFLFLSFVILIISNLFFISTANFRMSLRHSGTHLVIYKWISNFL